MSLLSIRKEWLKNYLSMNTYVGNSRCKREPSSQQDSGTLTSTTWQLTKLKVRTASSCLFWGLFFSFFVVRSNICRSNLWEVAITSFSFGMFLKPEEMLHSCWVWASMQWLLFASQNSDALESAKAISDLKKLQRRYTNILIFKCQPNLATDTVAQCWWPAPTRYGHLPVPRAKELVLSAWVSPVHAPTVMATHPPVPSIASQCLAAILCWREMF